MAKEEDVDETVRDENEEDVEESAEEMTADEEDEDSWQDEEDEEEAARRTEVERTQQKYSYVLLSVIVGGIFFSLLPVWFQSPNGYKLLKSSFKDNGNSCLPANEVLFTKEELSRFTDKPKILLGFLGIVYDVTGGSYYGRDGSYHFFAGKDGTRGFLTGEFTDNELTDDISDLDQSYFNGIDTWLTLYEEKYERVGRLVGAYYDENGCETPKLGLVLKKIQSAKHSVAEDKQEQLKYPPCNSEWSATEKKGRVWCSTLSGGISRSWAGRPRQFYVLTSKSWRCACLEKDDDVPSEDWCDRAAPSEATSDGKPKSAGVKYAPGEAGESCLWKHYSDCDSEASECHFRD